MTPSKYKVLYVDDESANRNIFYAVYKRKFDVSMAESGEEALEILKEKGPFHLLITDQKMPEMSGTELLLASLEIDPELVKIILSGYAESEEVEEAAKHFNLFLYTGKPLDYENFQLVLDQACTFWQEREDKKL